MKSKNNSFPMLSLLSTVGILIYIIFLLNKTLAEKIKMLIGYVFISIIGIFSQEWLFYVNIFIAIALYTNRPSGNKSILDIFTGFGSKKETEKTLYNKISELPVEKKQELMGELLTGYMGTKEPVKFSNILTPLNPDYWKAIMGDEEALKRLNLDPKNAKG